MSNKNICPIHNDDKKQSDICACGNSYKVYYDYRTGIRKNKKCPSCTYSDMYKKYSTKEGLSSSINKYGSKGTVHKKSPKALARDCADHWFSRYIRIKYNYKILNDGTVLCKCIISCGIFPANEIDNGHCFSREFKPTRFDEDNCRPQNTSSNRFSGEADHYKFIENLTKEIGEERFARIVKLRKELGEDNELYYREISKKYRLLTNQLIKKLGVKKWW